MKIPKVVKPDVYRVDTLHDDFAEDKEAEAKAAAQEQADKLKRPIELYKLTSQGRNVSIGSLVCTCEPKNS